MKLHHSLFSSLFGIHHRMAHPHWHWQPPTFASVFCFSTSVGKYSLDLSKHRLHWWGTLLDSNWARERKVASIWWLGRVNLADSKLLASIGSANSHKCYRGKVLDVTSAVAVCEGPSPRDATPLFLAWFAIEPSSETPRGYAPLALFRTRPFFCLGDWCTHSPSHDCMTTTDGPGNFKLESWRGWTAGLLSTCLCFLTA